MKIRILGWSYKNIRQFDNLVFDLDGKEGNVPNIYLIMMRNGQGKTTTTHLIRKVLSGDSFTKEEVISYKPNNYISDSGLFSLRMMYDSKEYYYKVVFDYKNGSYKYYTSTSGERGGLEEGRSVPNALRVFDNSEFINRFIFDGEQAQWTLNKGNNEAEEAITYLYQVNELDNLISRIKSLIEQKQNITEKQGKSSESIKNLKTRMEGKLEKYNSLLTERKYLESKGKELEDELTVLKTKKNELIDNDESLRNQKSKLENEKIKLRESLTNSLSFIRSEYCKPFQIHEEFNRRLKDLTDNMQTLRLPKNTAREFFIELSESSTCLCGHCIGREEKKHILKNADNYLGSEELSVINSIKSKLKNYEASPCLKERISELNTTRVLLDGVEDQINDLITKLGKEAIKEVEKIDSEIHSISIELEDINRKLNELNAASNASIYNEFRNIDYAKKAYEISKKKYQEATNTYQYTKKAERLIKYIGRIKQCTLDKLKKNILVSVNDRINSIISNDKIVIDKIDGSIILHDRERVSEGQTLAIAYAYIGSLFEHSKHDFPFLVDSPAASMDLDVRREVASALPQLFSQLIIFITSGETNGFTDRFYKRNDVEYVTIEGNGKNGTSCMYGKDYFSNYQLKEGVN